ncbi:MAG: hypothetical protein R3F56_18265 [Planctomycetota bacterium]
MLREHTVRRALVGLAAVLACQGTARGQFDSIFYNPNGPVVVEGFLALHDNTAVRVFSAFAHEWRNIAPTGSRIIGTGDWVAVVHRTDGPIVGYSARYHQLAIAPCDPGSVTHALVDDDVAVLVAWNSSTSTLEAHAYSGQRNEWFTTALNATSLTADRIEISRFVIGIDDDGPVVRAFGARVWGETSTHPAWRDYPYSYPSASTPRLRADGNVLLLEYFRTGSGFMAAAFSGVVCEWSDLEAWVNVPPYELDHNVAFTWARASSPTEFRLAGYSAYNGRWTLSGLHPALPPYTVHLSDNVVVYEDTAADLIEAFGARPGAGWAPLVGATLLPLGEDAAVAVGGPTPTLHGFSGLTANAWVDEPYPGGSLSVAPRAHLIQVVDSGADIHTFAPAQSTWSLHALAAPAPLQIRDAVALLDQAGSLEGYSTRWNEWTPGPRLDSPSIAGNGSLFAIQETAAGPHEGDLYIWDERRDRFVGAFSVGGPSVMYAGYPGAGRNLVIFESATQVAAFGVQRSAFEFANDGGLTPTLPLTEVIVEENVGVFVDGPRLWAYGSPGEMHSWYGWPNGTEYQKWTDAYAGYLPFSCASAAGEPIYLMLDYDDGGPPAGRLFAPTYFPGLLRGPLWLPLPIRFGPFPISSATGPRFHDRLMLPVYGLPLQWWTQSVRVQFTVSPPVLLSMNPGTAWTF